MDQEHQGQFSFEMPEPTRLMIAGDWHGSFTFAEIQIEHAKAQGCDAIIQVGDFGYWPAWEETTQSQIGLCHFSQKIKRVAAMTGIPVYWVDGNHENHDALEPGQGSALLRHLPRGHRWTWWGKQWMAVGGGVSVDKRSRIPGYNWFPDEVLSMQQLEHCLRPGVVDVVVAHDCPAESEIPGVHGQAKTKNTQGWFDDDMIAESEAHRALMSLIQQDKNPDYWFHGHYHVRHNAVVEDTNIIGLDKQGKKNLNGVIITRKDLWGDDDSRLPVQPGAG